MFTFELIPRRTCCSGFRIFICTFTTALPLLSRVAVTRGCIGPFDRESFPVLLLCVGETATRGVPTRTRPLFLEGSVSLRTLTATRDLSFAPVLKGRLSPR